MLNLKENYSYNSNYQYLMEISYDGTNYHGWQIQNYQETIQGIIENKLYYIYGVYIRIYGASRTDSGVHAIGMSASFFPPISPYIPLEGLHKAINNLLPKTIYINKIKIIDTPFNARFNALGKAYTYIIYNNLKTNPFVNRWVWQIQNYIDFNALRLGASELIGEKNFSNFTVKQNKHKKNPIRKIENININVFSNFICISFVGKSFLYKMIRSMVGSLIMVAVSKVTPKEEISKILYAENRLNASYDIAPSKGLFLMKIFYSKNEMKSFKLTHPPFYYF